MNKPNNKPLNISFFASVAAVLLFHSPLLLGPMAFLLVFLTPLPIFYVGLRFTPTFAFFSMAVCGLIANLLPFPNSGLIITLEFTLPAAILTYLASRFKFGFYSVGMLVIFTSLIATLWTASSLVFRFGFSFQDGLLKYLLEVAPQIGLQATKEELDGFMGLVLPLFAPISAIIWLCILLANFYLMARYLSRKGLLQRELPSFNEFRLPKLAQTLALIALILTFVGTPISSIAWILFASLAAIFTLQGFSIIHFNTRDKSWRSPGLFLLYFVSFAFSFPFLAVFLVGLTDPFLNTRKL